MFEEAREALRTCVDHLQRTNSGGTEIETFLVQHLLVLICREYETEIRRYIGQRAAAAQDPPLQAFVESASGNLVRSIRIKEVAGLLGRFGLYHKVRFQNFVKDNPEIHVAYDAIINNRHLVAHKEGIQLTLNELQRQFELAEGLMREVSMILSDREVAR